MQSDIDKLLCFLNGESSRYEKTSNITNFLNLDKVYRWTNEAFDLYPQNNLENKKILTITSSGDHALDVILKGATDIDSIDINEFSKYVSSLKIAMIKAFDFKNFKENYELFTHPEKDEITNYMNILDNISKYLIPIERRFWLMYGKWLEKNYSIHYGEYLFRNDRNCFGENNRYYDKKNYNILKDRLDDATITYYDGDIINSPKILNKNKYDVIYLSNILARINDYNNVELLIEKILEITNNNGLIYNYFFRNDIDYQKMFSNCLGNIIDITTKDCKVKLSDFKSIEVSVTVLKKKY